MRRWSSMRRSLPGRLAGPALFWTLAAVAALLAVAAGGWLLRNGRVYSPPVRAAAAPPLVALELDAPVQALAGEAFSVTVTASPPLSGTQILLAAQATGGLLALSLPLQDGVAVFSIPPGWSQSAGLATLRALGGGVTASRTVAIEPRTAANPLFTLTGPASGRSSVWFAR